MLMVTANPFIDDITVEQIDLWAQIVLLVTRSPCSFSTALALVELHPAVYRHSVVSLYLPPVPSCGPPLPLIRLMLSWVRCKTVLRCLCLP